MCKSDQNRWFQDYFWGLDPQENNLHHQMGIILIIYYVATIMWVYVGFLRFPASSSLKQFWHPYGFTKGPENDHLPFCNCKVAPMQAIIDLVSTIHPGSLYIYICVCIYIYICINYIYYIHKQYIYIYIWSNYNISGSLGRISLFQTEIWWRRENRENLLTSWD